MPKSQAFGIPEMNYCTDIEFYTTATADPTTLSYTYVWNIDKLMSCGGVKSLIIFAINDVSAGTYSPSSMYKYVLTL